MASSSASESEELSPSDLELVEKSQGGDSSAFDALLIRYQQRVYGVIYNIVGNHEDTNDLLMETFSKAYRSIQSFKSNSAFYTWLYRIAVNQSLNFLRKNRHRSEVSMNQDLDLQNRAEFIDSGLSADIDRQNKVQELQKKLNESLMKLSEKHRAVVTLFDIQGLSHGEIAKIMGCSEGTVRSRLFYAHQQLRKYLEAYL